MSKGNTIAKPAKHVRMTVEKVRANLAFAIIQDPEGTGIAKEWADAMRAKLAERDGEGKPLMNVDAFKGALETLKRVKTDENGEPILDRNGEGVQYIPPHLETAAKVLESIIPESEKTGPKGMPEGFQNWEGLRPILQQKTDKDGNPTGEYETSKARLSIPLYLLSDHIVKGQKVYVSHDSERGILSVSLSPMPEKN